MKHNVAAFLTYNSVGRGLQNGWFKSGAQRVLLLQGFIRKESSGPDLEQKRRTLLELFCQLRKEADPRGLDYLVVNCGKLPNQAISLSSMFASAPEKVILVHCGCGAPIFNIAGDPMHKAWFIRTGCGGIQTLLRIYGEFMRSGKIAAYATLGEVLKDPGK